jgi:hypothetical protein
MTRRAVDQVTTTLTLCQFARSSEEHYPVVRLGNAVGRTEHGRIAVLLFVLALDVSLAPSNQPRGKKNHKDGSADRRHRPHGRFLPGTQCYSSVRRHGPLKDDDIDRNQSSGTVLVGGRGDGLDDGPTAEAMR